MERPGCDTSTESRCTAFAIRTCSLLTFVFGCTGRSRLLLSLLRRFSRFSRNGTPVGRGHAVHQGKKIPPVFALSHVSCSIRLVTRRPLLFPTSPNRPSIGLPYGRLAMHRAWRTDGLSTFHVIDLADSLGGTYTPVARRSRCRYVRDLQPGHACKHWEACL